jgi:hypothetical protein
MTIRANLNKSQRNAVATDLLADERYCLRSREARMARIERIREVLTGPLTPAYMDKKSSEGWTPVAIVWERQSEGGKPEPANITEQVPYGLKISEDCMNLEQDIQEKEALVVMLEMIIQDKPSPKSPTP